MWGWAMYRVSWFKILNTISFNYVKSCERFQYRLSDKWHIDAYLIYLMLLTWYIVKSTFVKLVNRICVNLESTQKERIPRDRPPPIYFKRGGSRSLWISNMVKTPPPNWEATSPPRLSFSVFNVFNVFNVILSFAHVYTPLTFFYTPQFQIPTNNRAWNSGVGKDINGTLAHLFYY